MVSKEQLESLMAVLASIRELKHVLISKDIGKLVEIKILFLGDTEPKTVKLTSRSYEEYLAEEEREKDKLGEEMTNEQVSHHTLRARTDRELT